MSHFGCYKCGTQIEWSAQSPVSRHASCPQCHADLRNCRNCRHYDPAARSECREDISEPVRDKEKSNLCDAFQALDGGASTNAGTSAKEDALKKAEALFKKR
ncbi:MAG: hypothetical protein JST16_07250 [Bdellovibrionales bacterium]|nr:hypothetical protein [Bdellovibrionales bacterium]